MPITAVVDLQLGDCGKGKLVDLLSEKADIIFRWNGGGNAGHTIVNDDGEFKLHHIPSGAVSRKRCVLGNGMVIDPVVLAGERAMLSGRGYATDPGTFMISDRAHLVAPWHCLEDAMVEGGGKSGVGSTKRGIAYAYSHKMRRTGLRFADFVGQTFKASLELIQTRLEDELGRIRLQYGPCDYGEKPIHELAYEYASAIFSLLPNVCATEVVLTDALARGEYLLGEGAQGHFLDIDFGRYPYVTSSTACAGGIFAGTGIPPREMPYVIGVVKAYMTYVGTGPLPTEMPEGVASVVQDVGAEFGTTTGRRRRVGWFDAPMVREAVIRNAVSEVCVTKLDVLTGIPVLKVASGYLKDGVYSEKCPALAEDIGKLVPHYAEMSGWDYDIGKASSFEEIRKNAPDAIRYLKLLERKIGAPIATLSTGRHRNQTFFIDL